MVRPLAPNSRMLTWTLRKNFGDCSPFSILNTSPCSSWTATFSWSTENAAAANFARSSPRCLNCLMTSSASSAGVAFGEK